MGLEKVKEQALAFSQGCKDFEVSSLQVTKEGLLRLHDDAFTLSPRAKSQLCKVAGCSTRFFDILASFGLADVVSHTLPRRASWLVRTRDDTVRAILSTRYKVFDHKDLVEVALPALEVSLSLFDFSDPRWVYLTDDLAVLEVKGVKSTFHDVPYFPYLVLLNSETGVGAATVGVRLRLSTGSVFTRLRRVIHIAQFRGLDVSGAVADVLELAPILEDRAASLEVKLRPIDRRFFVQKYGKSLAEMMWGTFDDVIVKKLSELLLLTESDQVSVPLRVQLQEDLFKVLCLPQKYISGGWIVSWP